MPTPIRLTANEFIEKFKTVNPRSVSTDERNREITLWTWKEEGGVEGDDESGYSVTYVGPDPDRTGFIQYMQFLAEVYKATNHKDFIYAYIFSKLVSK